LPSDVIQSGANIEKAISDDDGEIARGLRSEPNTEKSRVQVIRVYLREKLALAMFEPLADFGYDLKVLVCPDQFELGAVERMSHATS
jgi:hypothetical protein